MKKTYSYIALGIAIVAFIYGFVQTGSLIASFVIAGIAMVWFLFENIFELLSLLGFKSDKKPNNKQYEKDKKALKKVTGNNPTLR